MIMRGNGHTMQYIKDFVIHSFRGLRNLNMETLGQINLLVGDNNSGKTSVLEALYIYCDSCNWRKWYDVALQREQTATMRSPLIDRIEWLFPQGIKSIDGALSDLAEIIFSSSGAFPIEKVVASYEKYTEIPKVAPNLEEVLEDREVEVEAIRLNVSARGKEVTLFGDHFTWDGSFAFIEGFPLPPVSKQDIPTLQVQMLSPFSHRSNSLAPRLWSEVIAADLKLETIELLRFFDPAIQDVDIITPTERRQLVAIKHDKLGRAPLHTFGDGLRRVFTLATAIPRVKGGFLLIDELEAAIHTKALEKTIGWLVKACIHNDVQLVATTHSLEALDTVLAVSHDPVDLVVYRLQQEKEQTTTTRFSKEIILRLREELGVEVRV